MVEQILLGASFAFAAAVQPGPLQAYLIAQTLANGLRRTIPAAFAPILSDIPIAILVLLVLTNVPPMFIAILQLVGGSFLLYLAFGAYWAFRRYEHQETVPRRPVHRTFFKAVLVNLLNPNAYMGWGLVMGPLVAKAWQQSHMSSIALILAFYITMVLVTLTLLALFSRARSLGARLTRTLVGLSAVALACFGLYQLWNGGSSVIRLFGI